MAASLSVFFRWGTAGNIYGGALIQLSGQLCRFAAVGGAATLTHMGIAAALISTDLSWPVWLINLIAFAVAFWVSFFGHRYFTFQSAGSPLKFLGAALAGLAVNNLCLAATFWLTRHDLASIILAAIASPLAVYVISRFWVFNEQA